MEKFTLSELTGIGNVVNKIMLEFERKRAQTMGGRFIITGVQLGMVKAELKIIEQSIGDEKLKGILNMLEEIHDKQYIGESENEMPNDINDMRNLWASWCGKAATDEENEMFDSYFTLYWRDGKREIVKGTDVADAMNHAGYGQGAVKALDFYSKGVDYDYEWNTGTKEWHRKHEDSNKSEE